MIPGGVHEPVPVVSVEFPEPFFVAGFVGEHHHEVAAILLGVSFEGVQQQAANAPDCHSVCTKNFTMYEQAQLSGRSS